MNEEGIIFGIMIAAMGISSALALVAAVRNLSTFDRVAPIILAIASFSVWDVVMLHGSPAEQFTVTARIICWSLCAVPYACWLTFRGTVFSRIMAFSLITQAFAMLTFSFLDYASWSYLRNVGRIVWP